MHHHVIFCTACLKWKEMSDTICYMTEPCVSLWSQCSCFTSCNECPSAICKSWGSSANTVTWLWAMWTVVQFPAGSRDFCLSETSGLSLWPTYPFTKCVQWPGLAAGHWPASSARLRMSTMCRFAMLGDNFILLQNICKVTLVCHSCTALPLSPRQ